MLALLTSSLGIAAKLEQLCFASLLVALRDLRQFSWFLQTFFSMLHCSSTLKGTLGETVAYNGLLLTTFLKVLVLALSGTLFAVLVAEMLSFKYCSSEKGCLADFVKRFPTSSHGSPL